MSFSHSVDLSLNSDFIKDVDCAFFVAKTRGSLSLSLSFFFSQAQCLRYEVARTVDIARGEKKGNCRWHYSSSRPTRSWTDARLHLANENLTRFAEKFLSGDMRVLPTDTLQSDTCHATYSRLPLGHPLEVPPDGPPVASPDIGYILTNAILLTPPTGIFNPKLTFRRHFPGGHL